MHVKLPHLINCRQDFFVADAISLAVFLIYRQSTKAINNLWRRCIILDCKGLSNLVCNPNAGIGLGCRNPLVPCGRGNLIFFCCPSQNLSAAVTQAPLYSIVRYVVCHKKH